MASDISRGQLVLAYKLVTGWGCSERFSCGPGVHR